MAEEVVTNGFTLQVERRPGASSDLLVGDGESADLSLLTSYELLTAAAQLLPVHERPAFVAIVAELQLRAKDKRDRRDAIIVALRNDLRAAEFKRDEAIDLGALAVQIADRRIEMLADATLDLVGAALDDERFPMLLLTMEPGIDVRAVERVREQLNRYIGRVSVPITDFADHEGRHESE